MKQAGIITLFPDMFSALTEYGVTGRACRGGQVSVECWNPRDFTTDRHRTVDDRPFGGGAGMLMKTDPLRAAIRHARERMAAETPVIYLSPQGRTLDHEGVGELARRDSLILLCGRYQGMDERVLSADVDEEWSIGDYVLSGGELAAMVLLDAVMRQQPGVLGHEDSVTQDSFATGLLHCPQYTRPRVIDGQGVPDVLLGGDHEQIRRWQLKQSLGRTWQRRPELLSARELTEEEQELLNEFISEHAGAYGDEQKQDYRAD